MKYGIYSFRDIKLGYMTPHYQPNDEVAIRAAKEAINDPRSGDLNRYRADMEYWKLGEFDDRTGTIEGEPKLLANCGELIKERKAE